eukprot:TRINITY_DN16329_c0_g1_i1.p1 TRINITY_DN16329_c0_g1~~TRINITY_DN16329_c0_g1_i1.p1  ORF type:complete len:493 (-),score=129.74 TRINITY_DN16329_c0_g1_i1:47-1459(-)
MAQTRVTAAHEYTAAADNQLSFSAGEIIYVVEPEEGGWALGRLQDGREGWFPYDYVQPETAQPEKKEEPTSDNVTVDATKKTGSRTQIKNENDSKKKGGSRTSANNSPKNSDIDLLKKDSDNEPTKRSALTGSRILQKRAQSKSTNSEHDVLKKTASTSSVPTITEEVEKEKDHGVQSGSIILARSNTQKTLEKYLNQRPSQEDLVSKNILQLKEKKSSRRNTQTKDSQRESQILSPTTTAAPKKGGFFAKMFNAVRGNTPQTPKQEFVQEVSVFGLPLEELVLSRQIPIIIEECVTYLEKDGVLEGIFRLSGSKVEIDELKFKFKTPDDRPNVASLVKDPHSVAVLLKQFFSQLPDPLFTFALFDEFNEVVESIYDHKKLNNVPVKEIQGLLKRMPEANQNVTKYMMRFLKDLSVHFVKTKMASSNLALVFGPNLLRSLEPTAQSLFGMNGSKLVEILILHYDSFFDSS